MIRWDDERQELHVGDKVYPALRGYWQDYEIPGLATMHERQVCVMFESGWMVSIIWGDLTYSSNHDARWGKDWCGNEVPPFTETPKLVEVGVKNRGGELVGEPFGYLDAPVLNLLLDRVQKLPVDATEQQVASLVLVGQGTDKLLAPLLHGNGRR